MARDALKTCRTARCRCTSILAYQFIPHFLFGQADPAQKADRYYPFGWLPTLFDDGAVVLV